MAEHDPHYITDQDIDRAAAIPVTVPPAARSGRVLVDDHRPYAVDVTGLQEWRVIRMDHPEGWLAVFAPDETAVREALADRLLDQFWLILGPPGADPYWLPDGAWLTAYPLGELERWVITEPTPGVW